MCPHSEKGKQISVTVYIEMFNDKDRLKIYISFLTSTVYLSVLCLNIYILLEVSWMWQYGLREEQPNIEDGKCYAWFRMKVCII